MKWFALKSDGEIYPVEGQHDTFESAQEAADYADGNSVVWLFDAETAREWVSAIVRGLTE